MSDSLLNKPAKIIIKSTFAIEGRILEVTDTHHIIETSSTMMKVLNTNIEKVDVRKTSRVESSVP